MLSNTLHPGSYSHPISLSTMKPNYKQMCSGQQVFQDIAAQAEVAKDAEDISFASEDLKELHSPVIDALLTFLKPRLSNFTVFPKPTVVQAVDDYGGLYIAWEIGPYSYEITVHGERKDINFIRIAEVLSDTERCSSREEAVPFDKLFTCLGTNFMEEFQSRLLNNIN